MLETSKCFPLNLNYTQNKKSLGATETWYLRRLMKIPWTDRKTNEQLLQLAGVQRSSIKVSELNMWDALDGLKWHYKCACIQTSCFYGANATTKNST